MAMEGSRRRTWWAAPIIAAVVLLLVPTGAGGAAGETGTRPLDLNRKSDRALQKLDDQLQALVAKGSKKNVTVFATVRGNASAARELLDNARVATIDGAAIVVGDLRVPQAVKLAG